MRMTIAEAPPYTGPKATEPPEKSDGFSGKKETLRSLGGLSFGMDNSRNDPRVHASWAYCPEAREDEERVFGSDPMRSFVRLDEDVEVWYDDPCDLPAEEPGDLISVFSRFGAEEGLVQIGLVLVANPGLIGVAYAMARSEGLFHLLRALPEAVEVAVERHGARQVIVDLFSQEAVLEDGDGNLVSYASSLRMLQDAVARGEAMARRILSLLGFSEQDIAKRRIFPAKRPGAKFAAA